jgi:hypothetical protein
MIYPTTILVAERPPKDIPKHKLRRCIDRGPKETLGEWIDVVKFEGIEN